MSQSEEKKALNRTDYPKADPKAWSAYQREIYASLRKPILSTRFTGWETSARKKVPACNFGYVFGSAGSGETCRNNLAAFKDYRLTPGMLVNVTQRDTSVELFGHRYPSPLIMAPVGVQEIMHPDAEEASARAARKVGVPFVVSTAATRSIEQIAQASDGGDLWFQLYWPKPQYEEITASLLHRARTNGYKVLVVTLDTFSLGWRPTDLDESYLPFIEGQGCQVGFSDPVFIRIREENPDDRTFSEKLAEARDIIGRPGTVLGALKVVSKAKTMKKARAWLDVINSETFRDWDQLEILKKLWDGPIVLKAFSRLKMRTGQLNTVYPESSSLTMEEDSLMARWLHSMLWLQSRRMRSYSNPACQSCLILGYDRDLISSRRFPWEPKLYSLEGLTCTVLRLLARRVLSMFSDVFWPSSITALRTLGKQVYSTLGEGIFSTELVPRSDYRSGQMIHRFGRL